MKITQELYKKAKKIIPGGTQLLSKRPELHLPEAWPAYYKKAEGCRIWDLDDKEYIDMSYMGIGSCVLGYADPDVNKAVKDVVDSGSMSTLNSPEEVELAELLCELHPWAGMVRYSRTGGEAMAMAVRIARAKTGKDKILFCGYHGWHDWYLAANIADDKALNGHLIPGLEPSGVPVGLKGTMVPFEYNNIDGFEALIDTCKGEIAAVVMEPVRNHYPEKPFLETIREITEEKGIVLIFDEITAGWRLNCGGSHLKFNVNSDIAVFAKGISNGYPMAAVIGTSRVMSAAQDSFISSTYWTEKIGPTAAIAAIKKFKKNKVEKHLIDAGKMVREGWAVLAKKHGLNISVSGIAPLGHFSFKYKEPLVLKTLFTQYMLEKGFLASNVFYASFAHKKEHIDTYLEAVSGAFKFIADAINQGDVKKCLKGPVCQSGFKRLT
ncbi:MAG: aminotransferase class III-fold pyridoxal phosphate-dependent enzyme, partial [Candidatus Omnitrophota bacterium]